MRDVKTLVRVPHGSTLYGTTTPQSDQDFKSVHLPSGRNLILQRPEDVIDKSVVSKVGTKNDADAIDDQSFSLQKFFKMLADGDTVATEILFAEPVWADQSWSAIQRFAKRQLLNRKCKGFVGYCVRQAAKYGIKGSRMSAVKKLVDLLNVQFQLHKGQKLAYIEDDLRYLAAQQEHMSFENIPHPDGRACWHVVCCDRKMPMTASIVEAYNVFSKVWENYGERARAAMTNEGIDWKAMSHAVRVARQAIELLDTGKITFPRPDAIQLLRIKRGELPYSEVSQMLETLVAEVHEASAKSKLPEASNVLVAEEFLLDLYRMQTR